MAEWSIAAVLKTVVPKGTGGSNPPLSSSFIRQLKWQLQLLVARETTIKIAEIDNLFYNHLR
jgi:hypothetical protein